MASWQETVNVYSFFQLARGAHQANEGQAGTWLWAKRGVDRICEGEQLLDHSGHGRKVSGDNQS